MQTKVPRRFDDRPRVSLSVEPFVDGYLSDPSDPDYAIQRVIDGELRNCDALSGTHALPGKLYPAYFEISKKEAQGWLKPALLRFCWNAGREPWAEYLSGLICLVLPIQYEPKVSPDTLLLLAQLGPELQRNGGHRDCHSLNHTVAANLRLPELTLNQELIQALRRLVVHLVQVHSHGTATFDIAWRLWRNPEVPDDDGFCLSTIVRRSLRAASKTEAAAWDSFWDLRGTNVDPHNLLSTRYLKKLSSAIHAIGTQAFARRLGEWIGEVAAEQPLTMTAACREVLTLLLHGCRAEPALLIDEALFVLSGVRWAGTGNARLEKEWLGELLEVIATRPASKAFACAESLSINPDTGCFAAVSLAYHQLLTEITDEASLPEVSKGVDEYDLNREPDLYRHQLVLDRHLRAGLPGARGETQNAASVEPVWRSMELPRILAMRQVAIDPICYLRAIATRKEWLARTRKEPNIIEKHEGTFGYEIRDIDRYERWLYALGELQEHLLAAKPSLDHADLICVIESMSLSPVPDSATLYEIVCGHICSHGYSTELVQALERWRSSLKRPSTHVLRRRIGWLLWFDDVTSIREKECWSSSIRKDLRSLQPDSRAAWEKLLKTATLGNGEKPTRKWQKEAPAALTKVGHEQFRARIRTWFEPFRTGQPLRLTVVGRDILRNLLFYSLAADDRAVDEAVSWFASANWRAQKDRACSNIILPSFLYVIIQRSDELAYSTIEEYIRQSHMTLGKKSYRLYEDLCTRLGRKPAVAPVPEAASPDRAEIIRQLTVKYFSSQNMKVEGDQLLVSGVRDSYSIHMSDGRTIRCSDGCPVRVDLDAFAVLHPFKGMLNGAVLMGPGSENYFRLKICAEILAHDDENAKHILALAE
jgi:hypothetical protein